MPRAHASRILHPSHDKKHSITVLKSELEPISIRIWLKCGAPWRSAEASYFHSDHTEESPNWKVLELEKCTVS